MPRARSHLDPDAPFSADSKRSNRSGRQSTLRARISAFCAAVGLLAPVVASGQMIDESRLVYREDFQGETSFPTTPESNTIAAPGLTPDTDGLASVLLSGPVASVEFSIAGAPGVEIEVVSGWVDLDLTSSTLGARSVAIRGRFENLSLLPSIPDPSLRVSMFVGLMWQQPDPRRVFALVNQAIDGFGPQLVLVTGSLFDSASVDLSTEQAAHLREGAASEINLELDHESMQVRAIFRQADWPPLAIQVPMPLDLLGPPANAIQGFGATRAAFSEASGMGSVDVVLFELYAVPQTFTVDSLLDEVDQSPGDGQCQTASGFCTLRAAIQESNELPGRQRVVVPGGTYVLSRIGAGEDLAATGDLDVRGDLEIAGAGAGMTIVDAGGIDRAFEIHSLVVDSIVSLSGLTIRNGSASTVMGSSGGGIENNGVLSLSDCEIVDNMANLAGGIMNRRFLEMDRCVVRDNEAFPFGFTNAQAGGIASASSSAGGSEPVAEIRNSAIVRNRALFVGGIEFGTCSKARVENSTIAENQDDQVSIFNCDVVFHHATVSSTTGVALRAGSFSGTNLLGLSNSAFEGIPACSLSSSAPVTVVESGWNASNDATCALALSEDVIGVPLGLSPLASWGGSEARVPQAGSPLIDAGSGGSLCLSQDQVGEPRPQDGDGDGLAICDMGAIEVPEPGMGLGLAAGIAVFSSAALLNRRPDRRGSSAMSP